VALCTAKADSRVPRKHSREAPSAFFIRRTQSIRDSADAGAEQMASPDAIGLRLYHQAHQTLRLHPSLIF
jgi:hypothetical protein